MKIYIVFYYIYLYCLNYLNYIIAWQNHVVYFHCQVVHLQENCDFVS